MGKKNIDIRAKIMEKGLKNHEVGSKLGMTETYFSKFLSRDLNPVEIGKVMTAIDDLGKEKESN